jgi:hypothetical protein
LPGQISSGLVISICGTIHSFYAGLTLSISMGLKLGVWDGLDKPEQLFRVGDVRQPHLAVRGLHFQSVTICNGFIPFRKQPFFQHSPVYLGILTVGQRADYIHHGE